MTKEEILAMEAGRELDALVAEKVMGIQVKWRSFDGEKCPMDGSSPSEILNYSTDISAAWEVLEKIGNEKFNVEVLRRSDGMYFATMKKVGDMHSKLFEVYAKETTAPLAICKAALLAVIES